MRTPIFEHGGMNARITRIICSQMTDDQIREAIDKWILQIGSWPILHEPGLYLFRVARELERRQIAAEQASLQPKWIERRFDDIQHSRTTEDYPGQMS